MKGFQIPWEAIQSSTRTAEVDGVPKKLQVPRVSEEVWEKIWAGVEADEQKFPYWMESWNSQFAMEAWLGKNQELLKGRVLEVAGGAGGLLQLLDLSKVEHYFFSDLIPEAAYFSSQVSPLSKVSHFSLDLENSCLATKFNLILGSDLLYEEALLDKVIHFLIKHLSDEGHAVLSDPNRTGRENLGERLRQKWPHYLNMEPMTLHVDGHPREYFIYRLSK